MTDAAAARLEKLRQENAELWRGARQNLLTLQRKRRIICVIQKHCV
jgi:hypothetical protein